MRDILNKNNKVCILPFGKNAFSVFHVLLLFVEVVVLLQKPGVMRFHASALSAHFLMEDKPDKYIFH